jgi:hypothetical protein
MKDTIGRCIWDDIAKRPCPEAKTHHWFTETRSDCSDDQITAGDVYLMSAVDEPMFQLELATRMVASSDPPYSSASAAAEYMNRVLERHSEKGVIFD